MPKPTKKAASKSPRRSSKPTSRSSPSPKKRTSPQSTGRKVGHAKPSGKAPSKPKPAGKAAKSTKDVAPPSSAKNQSKAALGRESKSAAKHRHDSNGSNGTHVATNGAKSANGAKPATDPLKPAGSLISVIDQPDVQEKLRELVRLAKEQGYLTYDDVNEALPENMSDPDEMETIMNRLRQMEIEIVDASDVDRVKDGK